MENLKDKSITELIYILVEQKIEEKRRNDFLDFFVDKTTDLVDFIEKTFDEEYKKSKQAKS